MPETLQVADIFLDAGQSLDFHLHKNTGKIPLYVFGHCLVPTRSWASEDIFCLGNELCTENDKTLLVKLDIFFALLQVSGSCIYFSKHVIRFKTSCTAYCRRNLYSLRGMVSFSFSSSSLSLQAMREEISELEEIFSSTSGETQSTRSLSCNTAGWRSRNDFLRASRKYMLSGTLWSEGTGSAQSCSYELIMLKKPPALCHTMGLHKVRHRLPPLHNDFLFTISRCHVEISAKRNKVSFGNHVNDAGV